MRNRTITGLWCAAVCAGLVGSGCSDDPGSGGEDATRNDLGTDVPAETTPASPEELIEKLAVDFLAATTCDGLLALYHADYLNAGETRADVEADCEPSELPLGDGPGTVIPGSLQLLELEPNVYLASIGVVEDGTPHRVDAESDLVAIIDGDRALFYGNQRQHFAIGEVSAQDVDGAEQERPSRSLVVHARGRDVTAVSIIGVTGGWQVVDADAQVLDLPVSLHSETDGEGGTRFLYGGDGDGPWIAPTGDDLSGTVTIESIADGSREAQAIELPAAPPANPGTVAVDLETPGQATFSWSGWAEGGFRGDDAFFMLMDYQFQTLDSYYAEEEGDVVAASGSVTLDYASVAGGENYNFARMSTVRLSESVVHTVWRGAFGPTVPCETGASSLIGNGDFTQGFVCWFATRQGVMRAGFSLDDDHAEDGAAPSLRAENDQPNNDRSATHLWQQGLTIVQDQQYRYAFSARADEARTVDVFVHDTPADFYHERFDLTPAWQRFERTFTSPGASDAAFLELQFGQVSISPVYVDDVVLQALGTE